MGIIKAVYRKLSARILEQEMLGGKTEIRSFCEQEVIANPFVAAQQEWDNRMGSAIISARSWRLCTFFLLFTSLLWIALVFKLSERPPIKPILVEVERETGQIARVKNLNEINYQPSEALMRHFIFSWVKNIRSLPKDLVLINAQLEKLYYFVTDPAREKLSYLIKSNHPFLQYANNKTIDIELIAINKLSKDSYLLEWRETVFQNGSTINKSLWHGTFTVCQATPKDEVTLMENPAGIWIDEFSFSRAQDFQMDS